MNDHPAPQQLPEVVRVGAGGWISGPSASIEPVPAEAIEAGDFLLLDDGIQAEVTDVRLRLLLVSRRAGAGRVDRLAGRHVQRHVVPQGQRHPAPGHAVTISWRLTGSAKSRTLPAILPGMFDALAETGPVEEQANQEQAVPVDQASEVSQRSLPSDVLAYALGAATSGVVSDVYGGIKALGKAGWAKLHDEPDAESKAGEGQGSDPDGSAG